MTSLEFIRNLPAKATMVENIKACAARRDFKIKEKCDKPGGNIFNVVLDKTRSLELKIEELTAQKERCFIASEKERMAKL